MRCEAPATPMFEAELEAVMVDTAAGRRSRRIPIRSGAMRALRTVNESALHVALACGIGATLLLLSPAPVHEPAPPLGPDLTASLTPAYLHQYGARDVEATIVAARERGYEVQLLTWHVPDLHGQGPMVSIRHAGIPVDDVPDRGARGPLLIVVGLTLGNHSSTAD